MIDLRPIQGDAEAKQARAVIDAGFRGLWGLGFDEVAERYDPLEDLVKPDVYYLEHGGVFLVLVDADRVIGTGGILTHDPATAELKRLWLLQDYRGQGLGRRLTEGLLVYARARGCRRVRLEVGTPELQTPAVGLYARLGFKTIERYRQGPSALAMEKLL